MFDYEVLRLIWWLLLCVLLIGFAVMDGFDLGLAALYRFIARDDAERRALLEAIEPVWDGNQVWFILGGGAVFAAWPLLYAASFSGLYLAMLLVLLTFIVRPVGFNYRNKLTHLRWRYGWDWALSLGGTVAALLFGVAIGNLFLGLPFSFDDLQRPVFTLNFFALLKPFALLSGVVSLGMLAMHGAAYAALKSEEPLAQRARAIGQAAALVYVLAFVGAGIWLAYGIPGLHIDSGADPNGPSNPLLKTVSVLPGAWLGNYVRTPVLWVAPIAAIAGALLTALLLRLRSDRLAIVTSAVTQAGTILTAGLALFPFLLPSSTNPSHSLTAWDASSSRLTLSIMLVATLIFMPIILAYTAWVFRVLRGRVRLAEVRLHDGFY
ncbi:cytochrome d ubiquinol oxidase subunit II [Nevskia soli]|uniref:cytochrome d ubiquinol oxidase subunit II n=1 Tax=Nevskia soli TaxID=418856 RepID=UPI0004A6C465|nr:cytochrome d ubiquinol oxidase subunit II [Nevskia soli]